MRRSNRSASSLTDVRSCCCSQAGLKLLPSMPTHRYFTALHFRSKSRPSFASATWSRLDGIDLHHHLHAEEFFDETVEGARIAMPVRTLLIMSCRRAAAEPLPGPTWLQLAGVTIWKRVTAS